MSTLRTKTYHTTLSIAGFDPSGGAGIQADIKTFSALGSYATTVLTALPVQNTLGVQYVHEIPTQCIADQFNAVISDIPPNATKIGMLHRPDIITTVSSLIQQHNIQNIVLDPVMFSKSGHALITPDAITSLKKHLLPLATIITPNIPEAEQLLSTSIKSLSDIKNAAQSLANLGPKAILIKGGHMPGNTATDTLFINNQFHTFSHPRIHTQNSHGTGCTLAAAITSLIAQKFSIIDSCKQAIDYLHNAIKAGSHYHCGSGNGPVHHFYNLWNSPSCVQSPEPSLP